MSFGTTSSQTTSISSAQVLTRLHEEHKDGSKRNLVILKKESKWKVADERGRGRWIQAHGMDTLIWCLNAWHWQDFNIRRPGTRLGSLAASLMAKCGSSKISWRKAIEILKKMEEARKYTTEIRIRPNVTLNAPAFWCCQWMDTLQNELFGCLSGIWIGISKCFPRTSYRVSYYPNNTTDQLKPWAEKINGIFPQYNSICFSNTTQLIQPSTIGQS